ncbi:MAG: hypothetical protein M5U34_19360 [Chloroflexi bacterium]|nr:hypothetical protein [Chloroflexota bacterium]
MTKRGKRKNTEMGLLKTLVVVGSVAATLAGTRLLAVRETVGKRPFHSRPKSSSNAPP